MTQKSVDRIWAIRMWATMTDSAIPLDNQFCENLSRWRTAGMMATCCQWSDCFSLILLLVDHFSLTIYNMYQCRLNNHMKSSFLKQKKLLGRVNFIYLWQNVYTKLHHWWEDSVVTNHFIYMHIGTWQQQQQHVYIDSLLYIWCITYRLSPKNVKLNI